MTRPARLAMISAVAIAVLAAAAAHALVKPAATHPAATSTPAPSRHLVAVAAQVAYAGPPVDTGEQAVLVAVARSGLPITGLARLEAPISRPPLIVTTTAGLLAIVTAPTACFDAPAIARAIHMIGTQDPAAPDRLYVGRLAGQLVLSADTGVWTAIEPDPC